VVERGQASAVGGSAAGSVGLETTLAFTYR